MAEDQKPDRSESESAATEPPVSHPHDKYFYSVFSDTRNAADLLRPYLPQEVARALRWSTLTHVPGRFVSDDWRSREADLLFSVERQDSGSSEQASRLMRELYHVDGFDAVALHVEYVLAAQPEERHPAFGAALRRNVPGRGGELMNYVEQMVERGRREGMVNVERMVEEGRQEGELKGRREGELRGRLQAARGLLGRDVPWSTIEAATGIDEAAFRRLKQQLDDNGAAE